MPRVVIFARASYLTKMVKANLNLKKNNHILVSVNDENKWMNSAMEKDVMQKISKKW